MEGVLIAESVRAIAEAKLPLVPQIMAGGSNGANGGTIVDVMLATMLGDSLPGLSRAGRSEGAPTVSTESISAGKNGHPAAGPNDAAQ